MRRAAIIAFLTVWIGVVTTSVLTGAEKNPPKASPAGGPRAVGAGPAEDSKAAQTPNTRPASLDSARPSKAGVPSTRLSVKDAVTLLAQNDPAQGPATSVDTAPRLSPATGLGPATAVTNNPPPPAIPDSTGLGPAISMPDPEGDKNRPPRNLIDQTQAEARAKSVGCMECHKATDAPTMHTSPNVVLGCTDCHGGDASRGLTIDRAHVLPRNPVNWETSANPINSNVLLNHESPEFIRFVNPGDLRVAEEACGLCHGAITKVVPNSMMNHGAMLWNAAAYNNGAIQNKNAIVGQGYGRDGIPLELNNPFKPTDAETKIHGWLGTLVPLPRFNRGQPGNVLRIFEKGQFEPLQIGLSTPDEPPGKPEKRLSQRGYGTLNRIDPTILNAQKTRLNDPLLGFMGSNDRAGDYRSSGCSSCHVIYANDRSPSNSGWWHRFGNQGLSFSKDPTISKSERGHPIFHQFTRSVPSSQCMNCHMHQGNLFVNPFLGYTWWDQETDGEKMYPLKQKNPTDDELILSIRSNPEAAAARGNWGNLDFLEKTAELNPDLKHTQFADYHGHGWVFRAVFKKDKKGNLLDLEDKKVAPGDFKNAVHLKDIHLAKGMQCVDCHFKVEEHGNGLLYGEPRNVTTITCVDCHGTVDKRPNLVTTGAGGEWDGKSRKTTPVDLEKLATPFGPRFEWEDVLDFEGKPLLGEDKQPVRKLYQNSNMVKDVRWEVPQTVDVIDPTSPRYNAKARYAKTLLRDGESWGKVPDSPEKCKQQLAHANQNMDCQICHTSWATSCFGCHLPMKANARVPQNKYEGVVDRNFTSYNPQVVRDDVFQLGIDGTVKGNRMAVLRSSSAVVVSSQNQNREWVYSQIQTISGDGYSGQAYNPHFPHTTSGRGTTKGCTDCHVSKANDNNAWMASLLGFGTGTVNFFGRYAWVGGEGSLHGVPWTEAEEPQAVIGSHLQQMAYPDNYAKHLERGRELKEAYEHHAHEIEDMTLRGEYLFTANGPAGFEVFDVAQIDQKGFSERIVSSPVSPLGQRTYVRSKHATSAALSGTLMNDADRLQLPVNEEQPIHSIYKYAFVTDLEEGLFIVDVGTLANGNPEDNFLRRLKLRDDDKEKGGGESDHYNPGGRLTGATYGVLAGTRMFIVSTAGLSVVDVNVPESPRLIGTLDGYLRNPKAIAIQFNYAFVTDDDGLKVIDISTPSRPRAVRGAVVPLHHAHKLYVARTYAYVANGPEGLAIIDVEKPDRPRLDQMFDAGGELNDTHAVQIGSVNASMYALVADGKNGLRVLQMISPDTVAGSSGFSPRPAPRLIATYKTKEPMFAVSRGLDRDRVVDETGHQTVVFGRRGARPFKVSEMQPFLRHDDGTPFRVEDVMVKDKKLITTSGRELVDPNPPKPIIVPKPSTTEPKLDLKKFDLPVIPDDSRFPGFGAPPAATPAGPRPVPKAQ